MTIDAADYALVYGPTDWPDELPDHLSQSSLGMLERCPEMFRRRYLLDEKEAPSSSLIWGIADGKAHGVNFTQKIESHEDIPVADVEQAFAAAFDEELDMAGGAGEIDWRESTAGTVLDQGVALVSTYHRQVSPRVQPTAVEERFDLEIPGVSVPYIGYIDVSEEGQSIERKTAAQRAKTIPPHYRLQTVTYALARQLPVEVHISTRTKQPAVVTAQEEPGLLLPFTSQVAQQAERVIQNRARHLLALWHDFGLDQPWPDAIGTMAWHTPICELCGWGPTAANTCPWWAS